MWIVVCIVLIPMQSFAHSGGTDADGGHIDHSTGEYHWHHGYGPHQHYDMNGDGILECPILYGSSQNNDNDASSRQNNRTISRSSGTSYASTASPQPGQAHTMRSEDSTDQKKTSANWFLWGMILSIIVGFILFCRCRLFKNEWKTAEEKIHRIQEEHRREKVQIERETQEQINQMRQREQIKNQLEKERFERENAEMLSRIQNANKRQQAQLEQDFVELLNAAKKLGDGYLLMLSQAPLNHVVTVDGLFGSIGLPAEIDNSGLKWGSAYTFYCSEKTNHPKYHRAGCRYCNSGAAINAYQLKRRRVEPCLICKPQFPDLEWYERYLKLKGIIERHGENKV